MVCNWELAEARKKDALDRARVRGEQPPSEFLAEERGLHSSIEADVRNLLEGKTSNELEALRSQIESQMSSGTAKVVEYWEAVLKRLQIYKAKVFISRSSLISYKLFAIQALGHTSELLWSQACLKEIHAKMLRKHLQRLEPPLKGDDMLENDNSLRFSEEDIEDDDTQGFCPLPFLIE